MEYKEKRLKNMVAIITGASRGIGKAIAIRFTQEGAKVVIADMKEKESNETVEEIKKAGGEALFIKTDVSQESDIKNMIASTLETYKKLDILVNNAGVSFNTPIQECTLDNFDFVQNVDLRGLWMCCREVVNPMIKNKGGKIINISSTAGAIAASPNQSIYSACKGGVIQLTRALAVELCKYNINVNCIAPSYIDTPIYDEVGWSLKDKKNLESISKLMPCNRVGTPEEVAGAAFFLASDDSSYVMGHILFVDGGIMAW